MNDQNDKLNCPLPEVCSVVLNQIRRDIGEVRADVRALQTKMQNGFATDMAVMKTEIKLLRYILIVIVVAVIGAAFAHVKGILIQ